MPCPTEKDLAECALGKGRSRLSPEDMDRVEIHLVGCPKCRASYIEYYRLANEPIIITPPPEGEEEVPGAETMFSNIYTRFRAHCKETNFPFQMERKWKRLQRRGQYAFAASAAVCLLTLLVFPRRETPLAPPDEPTVTVVRVDAPEVADGTPEAFLPLESPTRAAWAERVKTAATPEEALAALEGWREELGTLPRLPERDLLDAITLAEQLVWRARNTDLEPQVYLYVARRQLELGNKNPWLQAVHSYALRAGDLARRASLGQGEPRPVTDQRGRRAEAAAYYDETLRLYETRDYTHAIQLAERLQKLYPDEAKAYEGQVVAARSCIRNKQPSGALEAYATVARHCPNELFAQDAARALVDLTEVAGQREEAIVLIREMRRRFPENDFQIHALLREGELLSGRGATFYPESIAVLQEVVRRAPDSDSARAANQLLRRLRNAMLDRLAPPVTS
jgi:tetratricopeptide (TPR) repeat protein